MRPMAEHPASQRAIEVARDLWEEIRAALHAAGLDDKNVRYHLDGSGVILALPAADAWVRDSVDAGFPEIRYYVEKAGTEDVVVNLAAFEDPDSQYWEPTAPSGPA